MVVKPARDTTATILDNGCLSLYSAWADESYQYAPTKAAMWIALQQHSGRPDLAAEVLAELWGVDAVWLRFEIDGWIGELRAAGLIVCDDC